MRETHRQAGYYCGANLRDELEFLSRGARLAGRGDIVTDTKIDDALKFGYKPSSLGSAAGNRGHDRPRRLYLSGTAT